MWTHDDVIKHASHEFIMQVMPELIVQIVTLTRHVHFKNASAQTPHKSGSMQRFGVKIAREF